VTDPRENSLKVIDSAERWADRFASDSSIGPAERKAVRSLRKYISSTRRYFYEAACKQPELDRRVRKIEKICWRLELSWFEKKS
jgi:hypothetical protein